MLQINSVPNNVSTYRFYFSLSLSLSAFPFILRGIFYVWSFFYSSFLSFFGVGLPAYFRFYFNSKCQNHISYHHIWLSLNSLAKQAHWTLFCPLQFKSWPSVKNLSTRLGQEASPCVLVQAGEGNSDIHRREPTRGVQRGNDGFTHDAAAQGLAQHFGGGEPI